MGSEMCIRDRLRPVDLFAPPGGPPWRLRFPAAAYKAMGHMHEAAWRARTARGLHLQVAMRLHMHMHMHIMLLLHVHVTPNG